MAKLEKLEEELYTTEGDKDLARRARERPLPPPIQGRAPIKWPEELPSPQTPYTRYMPLVLKIGFAALLIGVIVGAAVFIFLYLGTRGAEVNLSIEGRDPLESGELAVIPIYIKNISGSALEEVELTVFLPENSILNENGIDKPAPPRMQKKLENLEPNAETLVEINTRMFGEEGETKEIRASLLYRPKNLRAKFSSSVSKNFKIAHVPLALSWDIPDEISRGQEVEIKIRYGSNARIIFENLAIRLEYPPGFTFRSSDPVSSSENNLWEIGNLEPGKEGALILKGILDGEEGELKAFRGGLGVFNSITGEWRPYTESNKVAKIRISPLSVQSFLGGSRSGTVYPGDRLTFSVSYKNNTEFILRNATLKVFLEGAILEPQTIFVSRGGVLDALTRAIIWSPASTEELRDLNPGESGEFTFGVQTKSRPAMRGPGDINLMVRARSVIEAAGAPAELAGVELAKPDILEFKVGSLVLFSAKSLHRSSPFPNTGPIPPKVGEKTTYTVQWEIRNFTNNLTETEVKTSLPPNVKWEGVIYPSEARISYNPFSGEVRWIMGNIPAGTGVLAPALVAAFQVSLVPAETDFGRAVPLTTESALAGKDSFTGEEIVKEFESVSTEARQDPVMKFDEGNVLR